MGSELKRIVCQTSLRSLYLRLSELPRRYTSCASLCLSSTTDRCLFTIACFSARSRLSMQCSSKLVYSVHIDSRSAVDASSPPTVVRNHHRFLVEPAPTHVRVALLRAVGGVAQVGLQELVVVEPQVLAVDEEAHRVHRVLVHLLHLFWNQQIANITSSKASLNSLPTLPFISVSSK